MAKTWKECYKIANDLKNEVERLNIHVLEESLNFPSSGDGVTTRMHIARVNVKLAEATELLESVTEECHKRV